MEVADRKGQAGTREGEAMTATLTDSMLLAAPEVAIEAGAHRSGRKPRITIIAYTGGIMAVPGWGPVALDLAGLEASGQIPLLADHDARVGGVVGHGEAEVHDGRLVVTGIVSGAGAAARQIVEMASGGFAFQASVGVEPIEHERIRAGERIEVNGWAMSPPPPPFSIASCTLPKSSPSPAAVTVCATVRRKTNPGRQRPPLARTPRNEVCLPQDAWPVFM